MSFHMFIFSYHQIGLSRSEIMSSVELKGLCLGNLNAMGVKVLSEIYVILLDTVQLTPSSCHT